MLCKPPTEVVSITFSEDSEIGYVMQMTLYNRDIDFEIKIGFKTKTHLNVFVHGRDCVFERRKHRKTEPLVGL